MLDMNGALFTSNSEEWETPQSFFAALDAAFHFTLDACATEKNKKCSKFYTKETDGLSQNWNGETVFLQSAVRSENLSMDPQVCQRGGFWGNNSCCVASRADGYSGLS